MNENELMTTEKNKKNLSMNLNKLKNFKRITIIL